jgi:hypothetical protein
VVVNALNSRGLVPYVPGNCPASESCTGYGSRTLKFDRDADKVHDEALGAIAEATGGTYFHNNNDYDEAFRRLAGVPEYHYVLGFSPRDTQLDDKFHPLKVTVVNRRGLEVKARQGYYASSRDLSPEETAEYEIEDALYSPVDPSGPLSFDLRSRIEPASNADCALEISALLDPKELHMRRDDGVSRKSLTVVFGLFNSRGRVLQVTRKDVGLQVRDLDMEKMSGRWVPVKSIFPVKPGAYQIRVVVRDGDERRLGAVSSAVEVGGGW